MSVFKSRWQFGEMASALGLRGTSVGPGGYASAMRQKGHGGSGYAILVLIACVEEGRSWRAQTLHSSIEGRDGAAKLDVRTWRSRERRFWSISLPMLVVKGDWKARMATTLVS